MPLAYDFFKIIKMNAEDVFQYGRDMALKYKRTWRHRVANQIHLHVIRAKEAEVSFEVVL